MKLLKKHIGKDGAGSVTVLCLEEEDFWYVYNLISEGDVLVTKFDRKVVNEDKTGKGKTRRVNLTVRMKVISIRFLSDKKDIGVEIVCKNIEQNEYMSMGQITHIGLHLKTPITIIKAHWDRIHFDYLKEGDQTSLGSAESGAILIEEGFANIYYLKTNFSLWRARVEKSLPKKRPGFAGDSFEKALNSFFEGVINAFKTSFDLEKVKSVVVAGPGFTPGQFMKYMKEQSETAVHSDLAPIIKNIVVTHAPNAYKSSLEEVFKDKSVTDKMINLRAVQEVKIFDEFLKILKLEPDLITYGEREVIEASKLKAIKQLLISDELFRSKDFRKRRMFIQICDDVKKSGGQVAYFNTMHPSGERLNEMTGIGAILHYPINLEEYLANAEETKEDPKEKEDEKISDEMMELIESSKDDKFEEYEDME